MLELVLLGKAVMIGGLVAAAVLLLAMRGRPHPWRQGACWSWAIGAGVLAASGATDQWPHWPATEDRARFLSLLVPLSLLVETMASRARSTGVAWTMRLGLAAIVAPIVLHNTVYLADLNDRAAEWSASQATAALCGLAAFLLLVWTGLSALQRRTSTPSVLGVLVLDALATAVTVMLSGYYRAGLLGLGLAGALAGATLASYFARPQPPNSGSLGMGVIGVFVLVLMGRMFGTLSTSLAACLLLAPLLAWSTELPRLRTFAPGWRNAGRLACVALALIVVLFVAQRKFNAASAARTRPADTNAVQDRIEK